jgi:hypothetical protein
MKVWLDDERPAPEGWVACRWPKEVIELLETGNVTEMSLDHDLGDLYITGYDVVLWLEEKCHEDPEFHLPVVMVHSSNAPARIRMKQALRAIQDRKLNR